MKSRSPSPECALFITSRGLWVFSVCLVVFLTLLVVPSPDSLLYFVAILISIFVVGLVYISRRKTSYQPAFHLSIRGSEGQDISLTGTLNSSASLPIFYLSTTMESEFLASPVEVRIPVLRPGQKAPVHYRATLGARGVYRNCRLKWSFMDPIGILRRSCSAVVPCAVVVTPRYVPLPGLPWESSGSLFQSIRPSLLYESGGSEFLGLRPLLPGESLRRVHWLTTARKQQHFLKQFAAEGESTYLLALDLHKDSVFGSKPDSSLDTALRVLASIARYLIMRQNHLVGFLANSVPPTFLSLGSGEAHFDTLLSVFASLEPHAGPRISETLASFLPFTLPKSAALIIVTTSVSDSLTRFLLRLPSALPPPILLYLDARRFALPSESPRILPFSVQQANLALLLSRGIFSWKITSEADLLKWSPLASTPL